MFDSYMDILIIAVVALIIFGGTKKIPEMARNLGKATGEFKRGQMEIENELKNGASTASNVNKDQINYMKIAEDLNIETKDKTIDQIIGEINQKLGKVPAKESSETTIEAKQN
ncbi:Sec-independent protein translocase subunit TatA/TatB [Ferroplasma acidiphilum]|jgi:sec-independent protein translocase protein TatA|uniref:Sec-independent protein translocase protein TatA n=1 Tax=Ferroplasma acidiphilum TaxID=74969 RepID=A0A1V0N2E4_9ARCH|nr:twin-arginine translocase TatA/TatE family subunit [Ferroplasma acidiphilum]ARD84308.1 Sec-independent protein translocase protein TatA [Ferroplasma acidiphilum]MCL4348637.1 twin-arginine translocase TatA/TatE family subunit [Candidatus Thermoplasmatota archaeon]NOL59337.1 twin-arginine translocase TatA/TatE family subunit [Ferroplasma acidiphilum]WMT53213.1 MAG: twin-arginine translocase TatA/TatE family subunit [Ferroplasma acidiphilum]